MAEIYKARYSGERGFSKFVAVKRILPVWSERKDVEKMFIDEAHALVHLQHQNIVQIFELGKDEDFLYISMELVEGVDLRRLWKIFKDRGSLIPEKFSCFIISEILKALECAHNQKSDSGEPLNIVHRDVSPQNIMISYKGEVKLTDFGIAKGSHRDQETTAAQLKGKYSYMSPEQANAQSIDHRSDLYSLAIVLYEILSGTRLFEGGCDLDVLENVRESRLPCGWETKFSLNMRLILSKALAKVPEDRYQSAAEFLKDLNDYIFLKRLHTHCLELSDHLDELCQKDMLSEDPVFCEQDRQTKILPKKNWLKMGRMGFSNFGRYALLLLVFVMPLLIASQKNGSANNHHLYKRTQDELVTKTEPQKVNAFETLSKLDEKTFTIETLPPMTNDQVDTRDPKIDLPGKLSIQAKPWGYVYIPGVLEKKETPVNAVNLKPGNYKVKVYYAPSKLWARSDVEITPGTTHRCVANFQDKGQMVCR